MDKRAADVTEVLFVLLRALDFTDVTPDALNRLLTIVEAVTEEIGALPWLDNPERFSDSLFNTVKRYGILTSLLKEHRRYFSRLDPPEQQSITSSIVVSSLFNDAMEPHRKLFFAPSYQEFLASVRAQRSQVA